MRVNSNFIFLRGIFIINFTARLSFAVGQPLYAVDRRIIQSVDFTYYWLIELSWWLLILLISRMYRGKADFFTFNIAKICALG